MQTNRSGAHIHPLPLPQSVRALTLPYPPALINPEPAPDNQGCPYTPEPLEIIKTGQITKPVSHASPLSSRGNNKGFSLLVPFLSMPETDLRVFFCGPAWCGILLLGTVRNYLLKTIVSWSIGLIEPQLFLLVHCILKHTFFFVLVKLICKNNQMKKTMKILKNGNIGQWGGSWSGWWRVGRQGWHGVVNRFYERSGYKFQFKALKCERNIYF